MDTIAEKIIEYKGSRWGIAASSIVKKGDSVLLVRRKNDPFKGEWVFPGGFLNYGKETIRECQSRELREETCLRTLSAERIGIYDDTCRDPRGHIIEHTYFVREYTGTVKASDDAKDARFFPLNALPKLGFDHDLIMMDFLDSSYADSESRQYSQRVGILGGSFNPIHLGHTRVAEDLIRNDYVDRIIMMPCLTHSFGKGLIGEDHRLEMIRLALDAGRMRDPDIYSKIGLSTLELERHGMSHAIDTLEALSRDAPETKFYWIIGSDNVGGMDRWHDHEVLMKKFDFIVYPRPGCVLDAKALSILSTYKDKMTYADISGNLDISSSQVRSCITDGKSIDCLVDENVSNYIMRNGLYR